MSADTCLVKKVIIIQQTTEIAVIEVLTTYPVTKSYVNYLLNSVSSA